MLLVKEEAAKKYKTKKEESPHMLTHKVISKY